MHQLTIVKVGGKVVEDTQSLKTFLREFALIAGQKILIHGGGNTASLIADKIGIQTRMIEGRRVTDEDTLKVVTMVYAGLINKTIVARMQALSLDAVGMTGADMNLITSVRRPVEKIDYGYVGDVRKVNAPVLNELLNQNYIPVLASITHDGEGHLLNTNADSIASAIAKAVAYDYNVRLVYCLDKRGVLQDERDDNSVIPTLNKEEYLKYKQDGIIKGGMIPKLDNAFEAIASGVKEVILVHASNLNVGEGTYIHA